MDTGPGRRAVWHHLSDQQPLVHGNLHPGLPEELRPLGVEGQDGYPQPGVRVVALGDQLGHYSVHGVGGDGEADPRRGPRGADDLSVYPDDPPLQVQQRPAGVAGVDGRVGLDRLADEAAVGALDDPAQGTDDPHRQCTFQPKGVTEGDDELPHPQLIRVPQGDGDRQVLRLDANHRQIVGRIRSYDRRSADLPTG